MKSAFFRSLRTSSFCLFVLWPDRLIFWFSVSLKIAKKKFMASYNGFYFELSELTISVGECKKYLLLNICMYVSGMKILLDVVLLDSGIIFSHFLFFAKGFFNKHFFLSAIWLLHTTVKKFKWKLLSLVVVMTYFYQEIAGEIIERNYLVLHQNCQQYHLHHCLMTANWDSADVLHLHPDLNHHFQIHLYLRRLFHHCRYFCPLWHTIALFLMVLSSK